MIRNNRSPRFFQGFYFLWRGKVFQRLKKKEREREFREIIPYHRGFVCLLCTYFVSFFGHYCNVCYFQVENILWGSLCVVETVSLFLFLFKCMFFNFSWILLRRLLFQTLKFVPYFTKKLCPPPGIANLKISLI